MKIFGNRSELLRPNLLGIALLASSGLLFGALLAADGAIAQASLPPVWPAVQPLEPLRTIAPPARLTPARACDETLIGALQVDAQTKVVLVREFKAGERAALNAAGQTIAQRDLCLVKLVVGPGNPGPAGAPSTSAGIGIEVWLPSPWNGRVHNMGGGGWVGGDAASLSQIFGFAALGVAGGEGAISSQTDTGHRVSNGSFAMKPDGALNTALLADFSSRALHQQAVVSKALAQAYYGAAPLFSYFVGGSTGGRQGLKLAQDYPQDYNGIVANYPAINWTRFTTGELYPQIVSQRDLSAPLTVAQLNLASNAAINACDMVGGQHLGYVLDPSTCTYDPSTDRAVLCATNGGTGLAPACLTRPQALAVNKIWYGMTRDGSAPSPATDNGWKGAASPDLPPTGRWFGLARGSSLAQLAGPLPFGVSSDMVALELQKSTIAHPPFQNAKANGAAGWKALTYAQLASAADQGIALQTQFGAINTDNPDLSAFKARGGKMLTWHGLADTLIPPQGTVNYYNRVAQRMGGMGGVQSFYRLYLTPGAGHGTGNGTSDPAATPPAWAESQIYRLLTAWVETGTPPDKVLLQSMGPGGVKTRPVCIYPQKIVYLQGNPNSAESFNCL